MRGRPQLLRQTRPRQVAQAVSERVRRRRLGSAANGQRADRQSRRAGALDHQLGREEQALAQRQRGAERRDRDGRWRLCIQRRIAAHRAEALRREGDATSKARSASCAAPRPAAAAAPTARTGAAPRTRCRATTSARNTWRTWRARTPSAAQCRHRHRQGRGRTVDQRKDFGQAVDLAVPLLLLLSHERDHEVPEIETQQDDTPHAALARAAAAEVPSAA